MITIDLSADDLARVRMAPSPLWETVCSFGVLTNPNRYSVHAPWARRAQQMLSGADVSPLVAVMGIGGRCPDYLSPPPDAPFATFRDELERLEATPYELIRDEMETLMQEEAELLGRLPHEKVRMLRVMEDPEGSLKRLVNALDRYHELTIIPFWPRIREHLEADVLRRGQALVLGGAQTFFSGLSPRVDYRGGYSSWTDLTKRLSTRQGVPAWGVLVMPASTVALSLAYGRFRAPIYWSWFLGSQAGALRVVHIARLGSDLIIPALLALAATIPVLLLVQIPPTGATIAVAAAALLIVAGALAFGFTSYRRAVKRAEQGVSLRVAAVSVAPREFDEKSPEYRDVDGTIGRYRPHIAHAVSQGARLIVLLEYAVSVSEQTRERWLAALSRWAREAKARIVAGLGAPDRPNDQLVIVDEAGEIAVTLDKQHPAPGLEPEPEQRTPPGLLGRGPFPVSAVVCVDLDYSDLIRPVSRVGGVLAVPANDWQEIVQMHHRSAVWAAVMAGVPVVRSTGHGISAVYDAAGRVVAQANSLDGPVVLVADVPISKLAGGQPAEGPERRRGTPAMRV